MDSLASTKLECREPIPIDSDSSVGAEFSPPPRRDFIFGLICTGLFCGQMGLSIMAPFFPKEAKEKGVSEAVLGWIFSVFEIAVIVFTPLVVRVLVHSGTRPVLVASNLVGGLANVAFGFTWYVDAEVVFPAMCFLLRIVAGIGFAFNTTAAYSMLSYLFGPNTSGPAGTLEGINGLAMIFGPIVGASLFGAGGGEEHLGFVLPFIVLGGLEVLLALANSFLLPALPPTPSRQPSLILFSLPVLIPVLVCIVCGINLGLIDPTLQPHLEKPPLNYSIPLVGAVLSAACGCYALFAPLAGMLDDYVKDASCLIMAFGTLLASVGYGLLAPWTMGNLHLTFNGALAWSGACLLGVGCSFAVAPIYKFFKNTARHDTAKEKELAAGALMSISFSTGAFLGPTLGGMVSDLIGVPETYTLASISLFVLSIFLIGLASIEAVRRCRASYSARAPVLDGASFE